MKLDDLVKAGTEIGPYVVEDLLGVGGLARVYRARDSRLDRIVALKFLGDALADDPDLRARFVAEAKISAKLSHPGIVPVFSWEEIGGRPCFAMELIEGKSLAVRLSIGSLDLAQLLEIVRQVVDALEYAWKRYGLVHRDIKPDNILMTSEGAAKLADFGLAKLLDSGKGAGLTQSGMVLGTPYYLSPEQVRSLPLDHRSDFYSLGVTLYQGITGQVPFMASSAMSIAIKHLEELPVPPRERCAGLDPELDQLILTLMSKDPGARFQDHASLKKVLDTQITRAREKAFALQSQAPAAGAETVVSGPTASTVSGGQAVTAIPVSGVATGVMPGGAAGVASGASGATPPGGVAPDPAATPVSWGPAPAPARNPWPFVGLVAVAAIALSLRPSAEVKKVTEVRGSSSTTTTASRRPPVAVPTVTDGPAGPLGWLSLPAWPGPERLRQKVDEAKKLQKTHKVASLLWLGSLDEQALELAQPLATSLTGADHHRNLALLRLRAAVWKLRIVAKHAQDEGNEESRELFRTCSERLSRQILELVVNPWATGLTEGHYRECMVEINKFRARLTEKQVVRFEFVKALTEHLATHAPPYFACPELKRAFPFDEAG